MLLFGLKWLYGMDDVTENFISASARKRNRNRQPSEKPKFDIIHWLILSKKRLFLAARHCSVIRDMFFADDEGSLALLGTDEPPRMTEKAEWDAVVRESNLIKERGSMQRAKERSCSKADLAKFDMLKEAMYEEFGRPKLPKDGDVPDVEESLMPLRDFSKFYANNEEMSADGREALEDLLAMNQCVVDMQCDEDEAEEVSLGPKWRHGKLPNTYRKNKNFKVEFPYVDEKVPRPEKDKYYSVNRVYWRLKPHVYRMSAPNNITDPNMSFGLSKQLPDNFAWVLEYFARYAFVSPYRLYMELVHVEYVISSTDHKFFGKNLEGKAYEQTYRSQSKILGKSLLKSRLKWKKRPKIKVSDEEDMSDDTTEEEGENNNGSAIISGM